MGKSSQWHDSRRSDSWSRRHRHVISRGCASARALRFTCHMRLPVFFVTFLACGAVHAAPIHMELQDPVFRRIEAATKGLPIRVQRPEVRVEGTACFDAFGMRNLDLFTQISQITVTPQEGALELKVGLTKLELIGDMF